MTDTVKCAVCGKEIDLSDKRDVGETATFLAHYDKAITLMRWIRKAIENDTLIKIS